LASVRGHLGLDDLERLTKGRYLKHGHNGTDGDVGPALFLSFSPPLF